MSKKDNKKTRNIVIAISAVTILLIIIFVCIFFLKPKSNEEQLKENMKKMGTAFYEKFHYPQVLSILEDKSSYMEIAKETGITIYLTELSKYSGTDKKLVNSMKNSKTGDKCNPETTAVTIYPKEPYGKKDYTLEVTLDCGFDEK